MKIKLWVYRVKKKIKSSISWYKLKFHANRDIRKMAGILDFINKKKKWRNDEIAVFQDIDELRMQYSSTSKTVMVKDFGAGSSDSNRTKEEMENGVDSEKSISEIYKITSSPDKWGKLIFRMIREFRPKNVLELGTSLGISAAYQTSALKINKEGKFTTIEGAENIAKIADQNLGKFGFLNYRVEVGKFKDALPKLLNSEEALHFVFIDGHHDKEATKEYFEILYPHLEKNAFLIFDDINWSEGMREIWREIYSDARVNVSFDLNKWGICLIDKNKKGGKLQHYKMNF